MQTDAIASVKIRSIIPEYGILFDLVKKIVKVEYIGIWYIRPW